MAQSQLLDKYGNLIWSCDVSIYRTRAGRLVHRVATSVCMRENCSTQHKCNVYAHTITPQSTLLCSGPHHLTIFNTWHS